MDKTSENGARIQTGRGVADVRRRITEAFQKANEQGVTGKVTPKQVQASDLSTKQSHYAEADSHRFIAETNAVLEQAMQLPLPHITQRKEQSFYVGDLQKSYTAEDLFAAAFRLARVETGSKKERKSTT